MAVYDLTLFLPAIILMYHTIQGTNNTDSYLCTLELSPPYDHPVFTTTTFLWPDKSPHISLYLQNSVNLTTQLWRPLTTFWSPQSLYILFLYKICPVNTTALIACWDCWMKSNIISQTMTLKFYWIFLQRGFCAKHVIKHPAKIL